MLTNLAQLNVSSTGIEATGVATLIDVLKHNTVMAELVLLNCPVNPKDLSSITARLRDQPDVFPLKVRLSEPSNSVLVKLLGSFSEQRIMSTL